MQRESRFSQKRKNNKNSGTEAHKKTYYPRQQDYGFDQFLSDVGNSEVLKLFGNGIVQAKLNVSSPGDPYEHEADRLANEVVSGSASNVTGHMHVSPVQKKGSSSSLSIDTSTEHKMGSLKGKGTPLTKSLKDYYEPRFGVDLGNVRLHMDGEANRLSQAIHARAFTLGNDIVFSKGQYQPQTTEGKKLIAHELAHTMQQGGSKDFISRKTQDEAYRDSVLDSFKQSAAGYLKPLLESAIQISKEEKEKYFGSENRIKELVQLIKYNYGEMYRAADILRARALIRFFFAEKVQYSTDFDYEQILHTPEYRKFDENKVADFLMPKIQQIQDNYDSYDPSVIKEIMASHIFKCRLNKKYGYYGYNEEWENAQYSLSGKGYYKYDAEAMACVMDNYPEMYQAEMLDAATVAQVKGIDAEEYLILSDVRTDFYVLSIDEENYIEREIRRILDERENSSKSLLDKLSGNPDIIWDIKPLVEYTMGKLVYDKTAGNGKIVWDEFQRRERDKAIWNWVLMGLGIIIGIAGAIAGGLGAGLAAVILASASIGLDLIDLCLEINDYSLMGAASGATYEIVLSGKPSPLGIFIAIAGIVMDVVDLAGEAGKVVGRLSREISEEATGETIRRAYKELVDKKIIGSIDFEDFLKIIKGAQDKFPKVFFALPPNPAFFKLYADNPAAFAKLFAEGKGEALEFFGKYGSMLTEENIKACIDGGLPAMRSLKTALTGNFQEFFEKAMKRVSSEYQSRVRTALAKMPKDKQEDVIVLIQSIALDSKTVQEHHWIRQEAISRFYGVNTELNKYGIDLYDWKDNLSLIAGHRSGHLDTYRRMVDRQMTELNTLINTLNSAGHPLTKADLIQKVKAIITDVRDQVMADYKVLNNYKTIVLE
jgi:hypothetical protein